MTALCVFCFLAHCHASEEKFHQKASEGFKHLAKQCSDSGAVEKLAKHIFAVINGRS